MKFKQVEVLNWNKSKLEGSLCKAVEVEVPFCVLIQKYILFYKDETSNSIPLE